MRWLAIIALTIVTVAGGSYLVAQVEPSAFENCVGAGNAPALCAVCTNPSRGTGTSGSTAVCLCRTQLDELGQDAFDATYGNFGQCIQLEHDHGVQ